MKILGLSCGTKNGNNDTMCRVALEAARDAGAEIEFIHVFDWDIRLCTGCVACSRSLVMGVRDKTQISALGSPSRIWARSSAYMPMKLSRLKPISLMPKST